MRPGRKGSAAARALLALALAGLCSSCFGSSNGTVRGRIARADGTVLDNTRVALIPVDSGREQHSTRTDARGAFELGGVEKGRYQLTVDYDISGVFRCGIGYPVEVRGGKTLVRRLRIPPVDVESGGTSALAAAHVVTCRTLRNPVAPFLCKASRFPIVVFALPPRRVGDAPYRRIGSIGRDSCRRVVVRGRAGQASAARLRPLGWLRISFGGKQGWVNPERAGRIAPELKTWTDVARARAALLRQRKPALAGLPDLAFGEPRPSAQAGDVCFTPGVVAVEWLVGVRNNGKGLVSKKVVKARVVNTGIGQDEIRVAGEAGWLRGLAPGESAPLEPTGNKWHSLSPAARLTLDPGNDIKESNESNNSISLGSLPSLTCGPSSFP
jgi:hypothetical protein